MLFGRFVLLSVALAIVSGLVPSLVTAPPGTTLTIPPVVWVANEAGTSGPLGANSSAPSSPPAEICGNVSMLRGPGTPPPGATVIPAGNNSGLTASYVLQSNTTYWLAPGVHTLGTGPFSQFQPDPGDTFIGGPAAILDGQGVNQFAFTDNPNTGSPNVTIEFLTVEHFISGEGEGVVNQAGQPGWVIEHDTVGPNEANGTNPGGAGVMLGSNNLVEYDCLSQNGEYGFSSFGSSSNITLAHDEISYNDASGGYDQAGSPISCGCSGGGKLWISTDVTIVDDYVHNNGNVGIWVDTDNAGVLIAHNYISDNYAEGVIYEISYNGMIENNTFIGDAISAGPSVGGFPDSAVYISESGFDPRVANPLHASSFLVEDNVFSDDWGGVVIWENPNRYCSDGSDQVCTLVNPSAYTLTSCAANLSERGPLNFYDNCRWRAENVSVFHNLFYFDPSQVGASCTVANLCGFNGLFSAYGEPPYAGPAVPTNITFFQNNHFAANEYAGPWWFEAWSQGNPDNPTNWTVWRANVNDDCTTPGENASGTCDSGFGQDQGSTYDLADGPSIVGFSAQPSVLAVGQSTSLSAAVVGGIGAVSYDYSGLPSDCASQNSTALTCAPGNSGNFTVVFFANDSAGNDASASLRLTVTSAVSPTPSPGSPNPLPPVTGASGEWIYAGIGSVLVVSVVVAVIRVRRRGRRKATDPAAAGKTG